MTDETDAEGWLSLAEASTLFNFPPEQLRRRVIAGGVPGAVEVAAGEWRIPRKSLERLGYRPMSTDDLLSVEPPPDHERRGGVERDLLRSGTEVLAAAQAELAHEREILHTAHRLLEEDYERHRKEKESLEAFRAEVHELQRSVHALVLEAGGVLSELRRLLGREAELFDQDQPYARSDRARELLQDMLGDDATGAAAAETPPESLTAGWEAAEAEWPSATDSDPLPIAFEPSPPATEEQERAEQSPYSS